MSLKNIFKDDLENIFFNPEEFGQEVNFAGLDIIAIKSIKKFQKKYKGRGEELGIYKGGMTIIIKKSSLPIIIEPGEKVTIDGISYEVIDVEDTNNIYKIDVVTFLGG